MSKIKITHEQARKAEKYLPEVGSREESKLARLLKLHILNAVEDAFVIYCGEERMTPEIKIKWERFRKLLKERL